jgi:hypothetical protein
LQAQALRPGISALLAGVEKGLSVLEFVQPLLGVGEKTIGICPGLVQEVLSCPLGLLPSQGWVGRPNGGGIFWRTSKMISMASWCTLARTPLADSMAFARASLASSTALARISSASFLAYSWCSAARWSRRQHLSVAWCRRAQPSSMRASSAVRAPMTSSRRAPVMAASTPTHGSAAWGSAAILAGLPRISGRGGVGALEGPGSMEAVLFSPLGLGTALMPDGAAVLVEGALGVVVVLATEGAAAAAPMVSGVPPALGGSVVLGAAAAPGADCASIDARSSSSLMARGGVIGVAVAARSGPSVA